MIRRSINALIVFGLLVTLFSTALSWAVFQVPPHSPADGYVVDNANILSPEGEARLEAIAKHLDDAKRVQMALLTIDSLQGESLEETSLNIARTWGVGYKDGGGTGLFMLMIVKDRKFRTEVAPGLQGEITDGYSGQVADTVLLPAFREGRFDAGFIQAFETYSRRLGVEPPALAPQAANSVESVPRTNLEADSAIATWIDFVVFGVSILFTLFMPLIMLGLVVFMLYMARPNFKKRIGKDGKHHYNLTADEGFWGTLLLQLVAWAATSRGSSSGGGSSFGDSGGSGGTSFGGGDFDGGGSSRDW